MRFAVVFASVLLALGCRNTVPLDGQLALGPSIQVANLEVWPVLSEATDDVGAVLTLEQAQERDAVVIREFEDAQVGRLVIENRGDTRILACAGTVVTGGKQDRQLGEDIVVDPQTTVTVKTFCVEPGRWSGTDNFRGTSLKASAPVRAAGQYSDNQEQVWLDVEVAQAASIVPSGSYGSVRETEARRGSTVNRIEAHLRSQRGDVVGYAYAIDGCAAGIRTFAHPALLEPRLQGFVRAMCVEAELGRLPVTRDVGVDFRPLVPSAYEPPDTDERRRLAGLRMASDASDCGYVADRAELRERFNADWRELMAQLQGSALAQERKDTEEALRRVAEVEECALREERPRKPIDIPTLFRRLNAKQEEISKTGGANCNGYRRAEEGNHSACYVRTKDGRWVPLTRDWTAK